MKNPVVHFEITGDDAEGLIKFYSELLEWDLPKMMPDMAYGLATLDEGQAGIGGGVGANMVGGSLLTVYAQVDDINATLANANEMGCETVVPVTDIPGTVTFALFKDPAGNVMGIVDSTTPPAP